MIQEWTIGCPYCGEAITILIDTSAGPQEYVEDCPVCCRPMEIAVRELEDERIEVTVRAEDEPA